MQHPSLCQPLPIKRLDGVLILTDGHTRAVAALSNGINHLPLVWDEDELDWELYRRCVAECRNQGIYKPSDRLNRIITGEEYEVKWYGWYDKLQKNLSKNQ